MPPISRGPDQHGGDSVTRPVALFLAILLQPIAWPGWLFEYAVRRFAPDWEFDQYSATPYFLMLVAFATAGLFTGNASLQILSAYVLGAMELLGLWCSVTVALGRPTAPFLYLRRFGLRRRPVPPHLVLLRGRGLYMVVVTYFFTIYFFAAMYFAILQFEADAITGLPHGQAIEQFLNCLYFSGATITTLGYADLFPHALIVRMLALLEVFIGMSFSLFVFSGFVAFHINALSKDDR